MPKQALESLTESMFYLLMALTQGERCALRSPHLPPRSPPGGSRSVSYTHLTLPTNREV